MKFKTYECLFPSDYNPKSQQQSQIPSRVCVSDDTKSVLFRQNKTADEPNNYSYRLCRQPPRCCAFRLQFAIDCGPNDHSQMATNSGHHTVLKVSVDITYLQHAKASKLFGSIDKVMFPLYEN